MFHFVFCGSFETLLQNREDKPAAIGFFQSVASDEEEDSITIEDLVEYGNVRREIAGRIQQIVALNALTVDDFEHILNSRKQMSPIRQLEKLYMVNLSVDDKTKRILQKKLPEKISDAVTCDLRFRACWMRRCSTIRIAEISNFHLWKRRRRTSVVRSVAHGSP